MFDGRIVHHPLKNQNIVHCSAHHIKGIHSSLKKTIFAKLRNEESFLCSLKNYIHYNPTSNRLSYPEQVVYGYIYPLRAC